MQAKGEVDYVVLPYVGTIFPFLSFSSQSLFIPPQPPLPSPSSLKICDAGEVMGYRIFCESERKTEKIKKGKRKNPIPVENFYEK